VRRTDRSQILTCPPRRCTLSLTACFDRDARTRHLVHLRLQILPKGSVTLDKSQKGATLYMEPKPCMDLNNKATKLEAAEKEEEERVLAELCGFVAAALGDLDSALDAIVMLDLVHARAGYARCAAGLTPARHPE
jgi:hypothetical protein